MVNAKSKRSKAGRIFVFFVVLTISLVAFARMITVGYQNERTGFGRYLDTTSKSTTTRTTDNITVTTTEQYQEAKTLWDWYLLLLGVLTTTLLSFFGFRFNKEQAERAEAKRLDEAHFARENQREIALQAYLDRITKLIINHKLYETKVGDELRTIAQSITLTALRSLDGSRKATIIQFLYDANLILSPSSNTAKRIRNKTNPIIDLSGADLSGANLSHANLFGVNLIRVNLSGANLTNSNFEQSALMESNLSETKLNGAFLKNANCKGVNFHLSDITEEQILSTLQKVTTRTK